MPGTSDLRKPELHYTRHVQRALERTALKTGPPKLKTFSASPDKGPKPGIASLQEAQVLQKRQIKATVFLNSRSSSPDRPIASAYEYLKSSYQPSRAGDGQASDSGSEFGFLSKNNESLLKPSPFKVAQLRRKAKARKLRSRSPHKPPAKNPKLRVGKSNAPSAAAGRTRRVKNERSSPSPLDAAEDSAEEDRKTPTAQGIQENDVVVTRSKAKEDFIVQQNKHPMSLQNSKLYLPKLAPITYTNGIEFSSNSEKERFQRMCNELTRLREYVVYNGDPLVTRDSISSFIRQYERAAGDSEISNFIKFLRSKELPAAQQTLADLVRERIRSPEPESQLLHVSSGMLPFALSRGAAALPANQRTLSPKAALGSSFPRLERSTMERSDLPFGANTSREVFSKIEEYRRDLRSNYKQWEERTRNLTREKARYVQVRKLEETSEDFVGHVLSQFLLDEEEHRKAYAIPEVSVRSSTGHESSAKSFQRFQDGLKMLNNIKRKKLTLEQVMYERTRDKDYGVP